MEQIYPEGLQCVERTCTGAGKMCEEAGMAESNCYGVWSSGARHRGIGNEVMKLSMGRRKEGGGNVVLVLGLFLTI